MKKIEWFLAALMISGGGVCEGVTNPFDASGWGDPSKLTGEILPSWYNPHPAPDADEVFHVTAFPVNVLEPVVISGMNAIVYTWSTDPELVLNVYENRPMGTGADESFFFSPTYGNVLHQESVSATVDNLNYSIGNNGIPLTAMTITWPEFTLPVGQYYISVFAHTGTGEFWFAESNIDLGSGIDSADGRANSYSFEPGVYKTGTPAVTLIVPEPAATGLFSVIALGILMPRREKKYNCIN